MVSFDGLLPGAYAGTGKHLTKATPAQARGLAQLELLLADPGRMASDHGVGRPRSPSLRAISLLRRDRSKRA